MKKSMMNNADIKDNIGKCGFYCVSCPDFIKNECKGCLKEHKTGDCYTRDCVLSSEIEFCGMCKKFPCDFIVDHDKCTVLDKKWLLWKRSKKE